MGPWLPLLSLAASPALAQQRAPELPDLGRIRRLLASAPPMRLPELVPVDDGVPDGVGVDTRFLTPLGADLSYWSNNRSVIIKESVEELDFWVAAGGAWTSTLLDMRTTVVGIEKTGAHESNPLIRWVGAKNNVGIVLVAAAMQGGLTWLHYRIFKEGYRQEAIMMQKASTFLHALAAISNDRLCEPEPSCLSSPADGVR